MDASPIISTLNLATYLKAMRLAFSIAGLILVMQIGDMKTICTVISLAQFMRT